MYVEVQVIAHNSLAVSSGVRPSTILIIQVVGPNQSTLVSKGVKRVKQFVFTLVGCLSCFQPELGSVDMLPCYLPCAR